MKVSRVQHSGEKLELEFSKFLLFPGTTRIFPPSASFDSSSSIHSYDARNVHSFVRSILRPRARDSIDRSRRNGREKRRQKRNAIKHTEPTRAFYLRGGVGSHVGEIQPRLHESKTRGSLGERSERRANSVGSFHARDRARSLAEPSWIHFASSLDIFFLFVA